MCSPPSTGRVGNTRIHSSVTQGISLRSGRCDKQLATFGPCLADDEAMADDKRDADAALGDKRERQAFRRQYLPPRGMPVWPGPSHLEIQRSYCICPVDDT